MRIFVSASLLLLCSFVLNIAAAADNRDTIVKRDGKTVRAYILDEKISEMVYSSRPEGGSEQTVRWKDVKSFSYKAQEGGLWNGGPIKAMYDGDYDGAAKSFAGIGGISNAEGDWKLKEKEEWEAIPKWKRAYGLFHLGDALEKKGERAEAAKVFGILAESLPEHRLALYAIFRQGINLALSGGDAKAALAGVKKFTTTDAGSLAGDMEKALGVIIHVGNDDMAKAKREAGRVRSRFREIPADWIFWRELWSGILLEHKEFDAAMIIYDELHQRMGSSPKRRGRTAIAKARALKAAGKTDEALFYYLQLDVLPFAGTADIAEARMEAAKIYIERIKEMEDGDEKIRITELAKQLLNGVVNHGPLFNEMRVNAQLMITEQFSDGAAEGEADAGAEEEAPAEDAEKKEE